MAKKKIYDVAERDRSVNEDAVKLRGFFRLNIVDPDGTIAGDSGWVENTVTNDGKLGYLVKTLASSAGSSYLSYAALGEHTDAPAAADTALGSELTGLGGDTIRDAMTMQSSGSTALRCTGTFASGDSFVTATESIAEIGLFRSSSAGTLFAGNTFDSSTVATNQAVNYTWIKFMGQLLETVISKLRKFGEHLNETIPSQQKAIAFGRV